MRDVLLTAIVFGGLFWVFAKPHIGILLWTWISMMNPHRLTYGFAYDFPFAFIIAVTTLAVVPFSRHRKPMPWNAMSILFVLFVLWMCFTTLFAKGDPQEVYANWIRIIKIHVMLIVTLLVIRDRQKIDQLIWVLVVSLGYFGLKGGVWTVLTGGGERVWGPPGGVIEGNNELALALVMTIPLMCYLLAMAKSKLTRYGLLGVILACGFSVLGSHSRGAFLAAVAGVVFLGWKSGRKVLVTVMMFFAFGAMVLFMPENWLQRMDTIVNFETEGSAMSRLNTWAVIWDMSLDNPILGMGLAFNTTIEYMRRVPLGTAAHSIYFQALAEHGFVGLFLFLMLMIVTWFRAGRIAAQCRASKELDWAHSLMSMVQVSLIGFAVGGAFLGLLHFDLPYYLVVLVVVTQEIVNAKIGASSKGMRPALGDPVFRGRSQTNVAAS